MRNPYREEKRSMTEWLGLIIVAGAICGLIGLLYYDNTLATFDTLEFKSPDAAGANTDEAELQGELKGIKSQIAQTKADTARREQEQAEKAKALENMSPEDKVYDRIAYYTRPKCDVKKLRAAFPTDHGKYLTFETDSGGFNNIRMVFEYVVSYALVTGRTLVLPPASGWYLLDWGPMGKKKMKGSGHAADIHEFYRTDHLSTYGEYWNTKALCKLIPCITAEAWLEKERSRFSIPEQFTAASMVRGLNTNVDPHPWKNFIRGKFHWINWSPDNMYMCTPSISAVKGRVAADAYPNWMTNNRKAVEYTAEERAEDVLHFPICMNIGGGKLHHDGGGTLSNHEHSLPPTKRCNPMYRPLQVIAAFGVFASRQQDQQFKRFLHDGLHFNEQVFKWASLVVAKIGVFEYTSMHVRRNDLQYR
jgi:hypothetical protein